MPHLRLAWFLYWSGTYSPYRLPPACCNNTGTAGHLGVHAVFRVLPKLIFRLNPSRSLNIISVPLLGIYAILYPIAKPLSGFTDFLYRKIRKNGNNGPVPVPERISLDHLLIDSSGNEEKPEPEPEEVKFFRNALDFSSIKIRECYVPRTDLEAVEISDDIETLRKMFIETGFSKILVYRETIDNIVGYVHLSALFNNPDSVQSVITPISVVPESMTANKLLEIFTKEHKSIALVVDEFGGTSGIVTLEDILEEIFGKSMMSTMSQTLQRLRYSTIHTSFRPVPRSIISMRNTTSTYLYQTITKPLPALFYHIVNPSPE